VVHRQERGALSLFRLGLRLLARALKDGIPIPLGLLAPVAFPKPFIRSFINQVA
jgi:hypothetical protein